jgi:hypothetical protein
MANVEWNVPHDLLTPFGTVLLNQPDLVTGRCVFIRPDGYAIVPSLRVTQDNISQEDGSILHPRWKTGVVATMTISYIIVTGFNNDGGFEYVPACTADLREMNEELLGALNSIRTLTEDQQRLIWTPSVAAGDPAISRRMLDFIQVLSWPVPAFEDDEQRATFSVESPFPYAIDLTQIDTAISATLTNTGNAAFSPVIKVHGATSSFTITNPADVDEFGNPKQIVYDAGRPGAVSIAGGHYAEIDTFRGTIFLDGSSTDLTAGLDPDATDFFKLEPGANALTITGATADVLWNPAYS